MTDPQIEVKVTTDKLNALNKNATLLENAAHTTTDGSDLKAPPAGQPSSVEVSDRDAGDETFGDPAGRRIGVRVRIESINPELAEAGQAVDPDVGRSRKRWNKRSVQVLRARADLNAACAAIDEASFADGEIDCEALVLTKLAAHRAWLIRSGLLPTLVDGCPAEPVILGQIGHREAEVTPAIRAAIAALADLVVEDSPFFRSDVDPEIDILIDVYRNEMLERGVGLSRSGWSGRICWHTTAREIGSTYKQLTPLRRRRLRMIDDAIGTPGEIVGSKALSSGRINRIGAAVALLRKELERRRGRMPADPLHPDVIDTVELAESAGVSSRDLSCGPRSDEIRAAINEARDGKPLIPHPLIERRRFTYQHLKEKGRSFRVAEAKISGVEDTHAAGRVTVAALAKFLSIAGIGGSISDQVPLDFPALVDSALAMPNDFDSGWASQMRKWVGYYHRVRSELPLPEAFATAIKVLAVEVSATSQQMVAVAGPAVRAWLSGWALPRHESEAALRELEDLLRVPRGTLSRRLTREWRPASLKSMCGKAAITVSPASCHSDYPTCPRPSSSRC